MEHAITVKDLLYVVGGIVGVLAAIGVIGFVFLSPWIFWDGH